MHPRPSSKPRWKPLVITPEGLDRKFYEICALSELKNAPALRRHLGQGLAAVPRLRRLPAAGREVRRTQARAGPCLGDQPEQRPVPEERLQLLDEQLATVTRLAKDNELPDAILTESGLKITPAGCGGAGSGAGADRPNQPVTAAHQDHRTADGRGRLDGLQPPLHPLEGRGGPRPKTGRCCCPQSSVMRSTSG